MRESSQEQPILETLPALKAAELAAAGWLEHGSKHDVVTGGLTCSVTAVEDGLRVIALTAAGQPTTQRLALYQQPTPLRGSRVLLGCTGCGARVAALYWHQDRFRCHRCLGNRYRSQRQSGSARRRERVDALRKRAQVEQTPALFAKPAGVRAGAWRRVLADFADA
jgi:hypothetical protein